MTKRRRSDVRRWAACCVACLLLALGPPAAAQDDLTPEQLYQRASDHYQARRFLQAARDFALAYDEVGAAELAYNTARAFDRAGHWKDAQAYYDRWLAEAPPVKERSKLADKLIESGRAARDGGNLELATRRLTFAMRLKMIPDPQIAFELAEVHAASGRASLAREMYKKALADGYPDPDALEQALRNLEKRASTGRVVLVGQVRGVRIGVDGKRLDGVDTGDEFELAVGTHRLLVEKANHRSWRGRVEVRPGQVATVRFDLPERAPRPKRPPRPPTRPDPGSVAPPPRPIFAEPDRGPGWMPPVITWVSFGAAGIGLVAGGLLGSLAAGAEEQLDDCVADAKCATTEVATELSERTAARGLQANVAYGLAGAAVIAGVVVWLTSEGPSSPEDDIEDLTAGVSVTPLGVTWTF